MWKIVIIIVLFLYACSPTPDLYEQTKAFRKMEWHAADTARFEFQIADTAASYNIYLVLRHQYAFAYNNIRINISKKSPADSLTSVSYNFKLGENSGWYGKTLEEIVEHRIRLNDKPVRFRAVPYTYSLHHRMPEGSLKNILHAGLRIQKI
ncbi:gliding motility lipoprotein GldH [Haoranjiania flava]|uniref:Gliding motility lipoprotein GldH n=1 Tax=Haoranjiania flava TaxID=1856322 RepID=A0AAE3IL53_9BACT|nr:gliding motility lipoprotein GldH [Haoranjiania flava]MCU7692946.1 gliding motility lipoprotein GldH [Haoranjiania flava]